MADGEGRARAAHIHHHHADARQGQAAAAAAAALPSLLPAFSSPFQFLGLPGHDAAAPATMPPMVSYWPVGATPSTMRSTNSEACLQPLPLPIYMPGLFQPGGPSAAVAPAWGFQQHAHDSASAGMPQMAASASATASASALASAWSLQQHAQGSAATGMTQAAAAAAAPASALEQPDLMNSSSDDDSTSPVKKPKKRGRSAASLKGDSEAKEVRREHNRVHAKQSRWRKKERIRQLEQEVASHKQQLAAYRGAQAQQQGVVPSPDPALYPSISTQIQASINENDAQQAEHCLNTQ
jgi:hypothetical protein